MKQRAKFRVQEESEDKNEEENELIVKSSTPNIPTTEIVLKEDDTLQALSLRYHCPVAEIKRLNNLYQENEIFARRTIKVPYRAIAMAHKSGDNSPEAKFPKKSVDANILKEKLSSVYLLPSTSNGVIIGNLIDLGDSNELNENSSFNEIIFNTKITDKVEENIVNYDEVGSDEEVQLLPNMNDVPDPIATSEFSCNGADWGLTWPILLAIILIIAFLGPLIILYVVEHPEKFHHHSEKNHLNHSR